MKRKRAASLLSMLMVISLAVMLAPVGNHMRMRPDPVNAVKTHIGLEQEKVKN